MRSARKILEFAKPDPDVSLLQVNEKQINRTRLLNKLNYINFQGGSLLVNFRHSKYDKTITLEAKPDPCVDDRLHCSWVDPEDIRRRLSTSTFENLFIADGQRLVVVEPTVVKVDQRGISFKLPETCREVSQRKMLRHHCRGVQVQLYQNSAVFSGTLVDCNALHFRVDLEATPPQTFQWLHTDLPVNVSFSSETGIYFSGVCQVIRHTSGARRGTFVLEPAGHHKPRYRPKSYRSTRQHLLPSPNVVFTHPLTGKMVDLQVTDISGTGFCVEESAETSVLLPGLVIPELELHVGNNSTARCRVQVVYRRALDGGGLVRCGLAILDMDAREQVQLLSLLYQVHERNSYLCSRVDMEKLWHFFFETGFIYPGKYAFLRANKEKFRALYEKLYTGSPRIARHFIYQDKGTILGHMAMVRFYEHAWLIHHHAASKAESNRAGLVVLNQIGRLINDSHRISSIGMDYVFCYYRPDNRFPHRIFGGVARHMRDPKGCSLDPMAYLHVSTGEKAGSADPRGGWRLARTTPSDLEELERCYESRSGGLMIDALDLRRTSEGDITREYAAAGFKRERHLLSLRRDGNLLAVIMVVISDVGLNMSDLTNCASVFILDGEELDKETLQQVLPAVLAKFGQEEMPVLLHPASYAESRGIPCEKVYNLWVLGMDRTDDYFAYLERLLKTVRS